MSESSPVPGRQVTVLPAGLRAWRAQKGWTQDDLYRESGVSASLIALIETNRRQPSLPNALALARALGVPLEAFALVHVDLAGLTDVAGAA